MLQNIKEKLKRSEFAPMDFPDNGLIDKGEFSWFLLDYPEPGSLVFYLVSNDAVSSSILILFGSVLVLTTTALTS